MNVLAVGDSVMQGAGPHLYATLPAELPGIEVDAVPHRQLRHGAAVVRAVVGGPRPPPAAVVVHLGTNGEFDDGAFDELIDAAGPGVPVVVVTVRAPRSWRSRSTSAWREASPATEPVSHSWTGTHSPAPSTSAATGSTSREGAAAYASAIVAAVHAGSGRAGMLAG